MFLCVKRHISFFSDIILPFDNLFPIYFVLSQEHTFSKGKAIFDLSTNSLTAKTCAVLGKVLASDRTFVELKFADCMLSEDGMSIKY